VKAETVSDGYRHSLSATAIATRDDGRVLGVPARIHDDTRLIGQPPETRSQVDRR
jgi:hypothetical protein